MNEKDEEVLFAKVAEALLQVVSRECAVLAGDLVLWTPDLVFSQPQYKAALSFAVSAAIAEFGMIKAEAILDELRKRSSDNETPLPG